ncbi:MAG TPA: signal peptide peptidase SppA [Candidatus Polarisedimenticolia bacterium]|nr:signal peptide peptidase SppA [Candidatus Polarisedimenticolia bacterium]
MTLRRTMALLILACVLMVLVGTALFILTVRSGPSIQRGAVLTVTLGGDLPEEASPSILGRLFSVEQRTFADLVDLFRRAAADDRVQAIVARVTLNDLGWARLQELRDAMEEFTESGKTLACHAEILTTREYFLASACGTLDLPPSGIFAAPGIAAQVEFYKGALSKIGIEADIEHVGAYKSAAEPLTREGMSSPAREQLDAILDAVYGVILDGVAEDRGLGRDHVRALLDRGLLSPDQAREGGLVDDLSYYDEVLDEVKEAVEGGAHEVDEDDYLRDVRARRRPGRERIAVVYATGTIVDGESEQSGLMGRMLGSDTLVEALKEAREDRAVKAVVLRIDSPGGSAPASDAIWREARRLRSGKPLVVSMGDVAASGGYWIALGADAIVAQPLTITGSIGVVGGKFYVKPFYDWIGLTKQILKRGRNADLFTDYSRFTEEQRSLVRLSMTSLYRQFLARAAEARKKSVTEIDHLGQGRVWTGSQGVQNGLVDDLGGLAEAIALAREMAHLPEGRQVGIDIYPKRHGLLKELAAFDLVLSRVAAPDPAREARLADRLLREQALALMPFRLTIH